MGLIRIYSSTSFMRRSLNPWPNSTIYAEDTIIAKKRKRAEKVEANPVRHFEQGPRPKKG